MPASFTYQARKVSDGLHSQAQRSLSLFALCLLGRPLLAQALSCLVGFATR